MPQTYDFTNGSIYIGAKSGNLRHGQVIASHRKLWHAITYPCLRCLLLSPKFSYISPSLWDVSLLRSPGEIEMAAMFQQSIIVRRAGLLWSQQDFEWRWSVPLFKCLTVLEFSFILFDLCLLITFFNFIMNYVPIVTFWIFTYHKIWILSIMFCFIWSYWIIYFLACLEVPWRVVS